MSYELVIIGGGPAGLTAGLYGARGGLKTLILEKFMPGGQAGITDEIANYPGFPEGISGPELMHKFHLQANQFGAEFDMKEVTAIEDRGKVKIVKAGGQDIETKAVIICSGARPRKLGAPGEEKFQGRGVSYCATCDGAFFKDKKVAVVGGGDSAVEEGIFLTKFASEVVIIHRRDEMRAAKSLQDKAKANEKISFMLDSVIEEIKGDDHVTSLLIKNVKTEEIVEHSFDGVFVFVGTIPNTDFLQGTVELTQQGYVLAEDSVKTSIEGVFVAGDVREKFLRQVSTAVGDGAHAAMAAERYISELE